MIEYYKFKFLVELFLASLLFAINYKRRKYFAVRITVAVAMLIGSAYLFKFIFSYPFRNVFIRILNYICIFGVVTLAYFFCFKTSYFNILFCCIGGYSVQHISYKLIGIFDSLCKSALPTAAYVVICVLIGIAVHALAFFIYSRKFRQLDLKYLGLDILAVSLFLILVVIVFDSILVTYRKQIPDTVWYVCSAVDCVCCIFCLQFEFKIVQQRKLTNQIEFMRYLDEQQKNRYAAIERNVETINIKVHDLKKFLAGAHESIVDEGELKQLAAEYELLLNTGNSILDALIAERNAVCKEKSIKLLCNVEENGISDMRQPDIYSMFSNILDNAIEAVEKLPDIEKREIRLKIASHNELTSIQCENPYDGAIVVNNNRMPDTTKDNKLYHGFGLKSIKQVVEKYNGGMNIRTENNIFYLNIILCPTACTVKEGTNV